MPHIRILQIVYDAATRRAADPDFEPLDNAGSARPDWYEYWPIRQFLARETLRDDTLYGFFSPRFALKTRLTGRQVHEFARAAGDVDVVTFSPHPDSSACFINVFEQGEHSVPGLLPAAKLFLREAAPGFDLDTFVTHSGNTVFSNYILARPAFWRRWSEHCGRLFTAAEPPPTPLHALLTRSHLFAMEGAEQKPVQTKVFVMERLASVLLQQNRVAVASYPPFTLPLSTRFADSMPALVELDRLKRAFCDTQDIAHLYAYASRRNDLLRRVFGDGQAALPG